MIPHWITYILAAVLILEWVGVAKMARRSDKAMPPVPHTVTCPCPICGTTIPLTVHQIPTLTVMVDRTDLAAHLLTHEENR